MLSEAELEQRRQAARKHGAIAFRDRGEASLDGTQRSRLAELREQVQERSGVLSLLKEQAAGNVLAVELVRGYVAERLKAGVPLDRIPIVRTLPAFQNSANRALRDLLALMADEQDVIEIGEMIAQAVRSHERDA